MIRAMPANLTPQYFAAEERYKSAKTDQERLVALREMFSVMPKHKGTEKLQAEVKKKIAQIRTGGSKKGGGAKRAPTHSVERSGAAQVVLVGPANSGKSRLVADHTNAHPEVADYPYTTRTPTPGILRVDKIPIQIVDMPPITAEYQEPWISELVRNCDLLLVLLDLGSDELLDHWEGVLAGLESVRVSIDPPPDEREIGTRYQKAVFAGNKWDDPEAIVRLEILREMTGELPIRPVSIESGQGIPELFAELVRVLELIRVYTRRPGEEADYDAPFVLTRGSTVGDAAKLIHKELAESLSFARAWAERFHDGQPVSRDEILQDGDLIEFHE